MKILVQEKKRAIELRQSGKSYRDILAEVYVAKSTLSMWLKDLPLTKTEKAALKNRKNDNISRGRIKAAAANHSRKLARDAVVFQEAKEEFSEKVCNPFFAVGIALYWAEGAKRNWGFGFVNSDGDMMRIMVLWIEEFLRFPKERIRARLYAHKIYASEDCEKYWSEITGIPLANFRKTIYKPTGLLVKKRPNYKGCLRIELDKASYLRKMIFWQQMLIGVYGKRGYLVTNAPVAQRIEHLPSKQGVPGSSPGGRTR